MAAQQARIADTIVEMKRALARRNDDSDGEDPIDRLTNRGNKLMHDARHVQEGRLNNGTGPSVFSRKIVHAGYEREIIYRNPPRYDEDGDLILDDDLDDGEADISPAEDNIYADVKIEEILGPLTAASDLPNHNGMAPAYTSKAIDEMIEDVSETLRREQKNLRKMKRLLTALRGDSSFAPCGVLHTEFDDLLLNGRWLGSRSNSHSMHGPGTHTGSWKNSTGSAENLVEAIDTAEVGQAAALVNNDTSMTDLDNEVQLNGVGEAVNGVLAESVTRSIDVDDGSSGDQESGGPVKPTDPTDAEASLETNTLEAQLEEATNGGPAANHDDADSPHDGEDEDSTSQPTNHRMTTRAQANKVSEQSSPTIASPHLNEEEIPPIHPLFLFPQGANPDADFGLPKKEAEDARALLSLYVAKQEEIVRSFEELRYGLLKANRQRSTVLKWAKAEGHVGEMSDGEDWYDMEEWGLKDPLKKGEEEPEEEANTVGKKTRQRRAER